MPNSSVVRKRYVVGLLAVAVAMMPGPVAAAGSVTLVTAGLDSPRGIDFFGGRAVVAESGHGSDNPADCFGGVCIGNTSKITWVDPVTGEKTSLASGFFSIKTPFGDTIGVSGIDAHGSKIYAQIGASSLEAGPFPIASQAGDLIAVNATSGSWSKVADVGDDDFAFTTQFPEPNPATCGVCEGSQEHDANPTDLFSTGNIIYVADSGANTLTVVDKNAHTSVLTYFPWRNPVVGAFPADDVPTCVTRSGGVLWVATLAGHLYSVVGGVATQVTPTDAAGNPLLSHVTGCTADASGNLYLVDMFGPGQFGDSTILDGNVVKYNTLSREAVILAHAYGGHPELFFPYSAEIGPDGNLYVTTGAICDVAGDNPFEGLIPFNPCKVGTLAGGRVVRIALT